MYRKLFFIVALPFVMSACHKNSPSVNCNATGVSTAEEIATLQSYLTANSLTATQDPRGFFYKILDDGSGVTPVLTSNVTVRYTGKLLSGTVFESNASGPGTKFLLSDLITGWKYGIPLIKKGGSIILYLPPTLAYGCYGSGSIPGNTSLIFNIELVNVQ